MICLTVNKVEGAHSTLKRCLRDSKGDLCAAWNVIHRCTLLQHTKINGNFQNSIFMKEHRFKDKLYDNLRGIVSRKALDLIAKEKARVFRVGDCKCYLRKTHSLSCACEIDACESIPLLLVDVHWRKLTTTIAPDEVAPRLGLSIVTEIEVISKMFEEGSVPRRQAIKERLREIAYPNQTSLCPPPNKLPTRGRPTKEPIGSTKRIPCHWETVDALAESQGGSNSTLPSSGKGKGRGRPKGTGTGTQAWRGKRKISTPSTLGSAPKKKKGNAIPSLAS